jgi:glutathione S-transferase
MGASLTDYLLVSFKTCPWVQRAAIVLREKNTPFTFTHIDRDNRPEWFLAMSPHRKVPVLRIDDKVSLFESNAICEYLDETIAPRLHPADPIQRAWNRAWTDYLPTFAANVTGVAYSKTREDYEQAAGKAEEPFRKLEEALAGRSDGPFFNGINYSLVDAAYAPFLQRCGFLDRISPLGILERFPELSAWSAALLSRPSTHSYPPEVFERMYRDTVRSRGVWISQFC